MNAATTALARPAPWKLPKQVLGTVVVAILTALFVALVWTYLVVPIATRTVRPELSEAMLIARDGVVTRTHQAEPVPSRPLPDAHLDMLAVVRKEHIDLQPFDGFGEPVPESFGAVQHLFRSAKGSEVPIDPRLVELLMTISRRFEGRQLVLISGHRDPGAGTSSKSYHVRGMAADIAIAGVRPREVRAAALELGARGVGLYPSFVHVDVRDVPYKWIGR